MAEKMNRFMLSLPQDLAQEVEALKKDEYFNKAYAEMFRDLIKIGVEAAKSRQSSRSA